MFKSIFSKYFAVVSFIVVVTFAVLGMVQTMVSANFWMEEKRKLMSENAERVAAVAANASQLSADGSQYVLNVERSNLTLISGLLCSAIDADMLITDARGVLLCASKSQTAGAAVSIPSSFVETLPTDRTSFSVGSVGGVYEKRQYTASAPIRKNEALLGFVFTISPASNLHEYLLSNLQTYLLSMVFVLLCAMLMTYLFTVHLVRPLHHMSVAVQKFGNGDFSYRIPVKGQDEMAQLAAAMNAMAQSLASAEESSRSFVANVSHELKTPMTTIGGFIDGILDGTIPPEKEKHYLQIVSDEVRRLSRLVRAMLDLSRIDNGSIKLSPREFDLTDVCCHTLLSFETRIEEKHLNIMGLENCSPCIVSADPDLIGQVVYNLIDNAVKFTNEGGTVSIRVESTDSRVGFTIRNSGAGIPGEEMPHIFERFYKSDKSRGLDKTGVGLGLFIVKSVINLHGGEIYVRSAEGEYCEFSFWLPAATHNIYEMPEKTSRKGHN